MNIKRLASIILAVITVVSPGLVRVTAISAESTPEDCREQFELFGYSFYDGFAYKSRDDGTIEVGGFVGIRDDIVYPDEINSIPVTKVSFMYASDRLEETVRTITIPESITNITSLCVRNVPNLEAVYFNAVNCHETAVNELTCFALCPSLKTIILGDKVEILPGNLCQETDIADIVLPDSLRVIMDNAFMHCNSLGAIAIPDGVTYLGENAFYGCRSLRSAVIGDGVPEIKDKTFYYNEKLEDVTFGTGITSIGDSAFERCASLKAVGLRENVRSIGKNAFKKCSAMTSLELGDRLETIGANAFCECGSFTELELPDTLISIGDFAFEHCSGISRVDIPSKITKIEPFAFYNCRNISSVTIPGTVTQIGGYAFSNSSITHIELPQELTVLGDSAFSGCKELERVDFPARMTYIGRDAFLDTPWFGAQSDGEVYICNFLYTYKGDMSEDHVLNVREGTEYISPGAMYGQKNLVKAVIPDSVKVIYDRAFYLCTRMSEVSLSEGLERTGAYAFGNCLSLKGITLPGSITEISDHNFFACKKLESITIPASVVECQKNAFDHCDSLKAVYGYIGSFAQTKIAKYFKLRFVPLSAVGKPVEPGDVDADGTMSIMDATCIQRSIAAIAAIDPDVEAFADVDGDEHVTVLDATRIQRALAAVCKLDGTPVTVGS